MAGSVVAVARGRALLLDVSQSRNSRTSEMFRVARWVVFVVFHHLPIGGCRILPGSILRQPVNSIHGYCFKDAQDIVHTRVHASRKRFAPDHRP